MFPPPPLDLRPEVTAALQSGRPVVAMVSAPIAHSIPWPTNFGGRPTSGGRRSSVRKGRPWRIVAASGRVGSPWDWPTTRWRLWPEGPAPSRGQPPRPARRRRPRPHRRHHRGSQPVPCLPGRHPGAGQRRLSAAAPSHLAARRSRPPAASPLIWWRLARTPVAVVNAGGSERAEPGSHRRDL